MEKEKKVKDKREKYLLKVREKGDIHYFKKTNLFNIFLHFIKKYYLINLSTTVNAELPPHNPAKT